MGGNPGGFSGCKGKGKGKSKGKEPEWACGQCGFKNHAKNQVCGGSGNMGCKTPRQFQGGQLAIQNQPSWANSGEAFSGEASAWANSGEAFSGEAWSGEASAWSGDALV